MGMIDTPTTQQLYNTRLAGYSTAPPSTYKQHSTSLTDGPMQPAPAIQAPELHRCWPLHVQEHQRARTTQKRSKIMIHDTTKHCSYDKYNQIYTAPGQEIAIVFRLSRRMGVHRPATLWVVAAASVPTYWRAAQQLRTTTTHQQQQH